MSDCSDDEAPEEVTLGAGRDAVAATRAMERKGRRYAEAAAKRRRVDEAAAKAAAKTAAMTAAKRMVVGDNEDDEDDEVEVLDENVVAAVAASREERRGGCRRQRRRVLDREGRKESGQARRASPRAAPHARRKRGTSAVVFGRRTGTRLLSPITSTTDAARDQMRALPFSPAA